MTDCTEACRARVRCAVCGKTKAPRGRSTPMEVHGNWCESDAGGGGCPGYYQDPKAGHLWPNEELGSDGSGTTT